MAITVFNINVDGTHVRLINRYNGKVYTVMRIIKQENNVSFITLNDGYVINVYDFHWVSEIYNACERIFTNNVDPVFEAQCLHAMLVEIGYKQLINKNGDIHNIQDKQPAISEFLASCQKTKFEGYCIPRTVALRDSVLSYTILDNAKILEHVSQI